VCSWHKQLLDVVEMGPQRTTTSIRQKMTVISKIRGGSTRERLTYEPGDCFLVVDNAIPYRILKFKYTSVDSLSSMMLNVHSTEAEIR